MALKLRRQAGLFTNGILPHWISERPPDLLRTGAASSKRVLGSRRLRATGRRLRTALNEIVQANTKEEYREDKAGDLPTSIRARATDPMPGDDLRDEQCAAPKNSNRPE